MDVRLGCVGLPYRVGDGVVGDLVEEAESLGSVVGARGVAGCQRRLLSFVLSGTNEESAG